jgi:predicted dehydrogenase
MTRLRTAVIGAGHLGRIHARLASNNGLLELVGVADVDPIARQQMAESVDCPVVEDYRTLLGNIDAAILVTPTHNHFDVGRVLLEKGLHVFIEKPLTTDVAQANQLVTLATRQRLTLQVGHVERFNPAYLAATADLSEPKYIESKRTSGFTFRSTDIGVVLDVMIHDLDLILDCVDSEVVEVQAMGLAVFGEHEDVAHARLEFANGCVANVSASRISPKVERSMSIWGVDGYVGIDFAEGTVEKIGVEQQLLAEHQPLDDLDIERKMHLRDHLFETLLTRETTCATATNQIDAELTEFAHNVSNGTRPTVSGSDGRDAVRLAQLVVSSLQQHRWDSVSDGRVGPHAELLPRILASPFLSPTPRRKTG